MLVLFVVIGIVVGVAISAVNMDAYESVVGGLKWRLTLVFVLLIAVFFGIRYQLTQSVSCLPFCMGVNFVDRDFSNRDFSNSNFVEAYMPRINFSGANLLNTDFSGANLRNSIFKGADLRFTFFIGSDLSGADLGDVNLTDALLQGANLTGANLAGVNLSQTVVAGATLNEATLVGANLSNAIISGTRLQGTDLSGANLSGADLSGAVLSQANLSGANLQGANLRGASINLATLTGADLTNANLGGASLIGSNLASVNLQGASLVGALVMGANLDGADLRGAQLQYIRDVGDITDQDIALDPVLAGLNSLQLAELSTPSSLQGIIIDERTQASADLIPVFSEEPTEIQPLGKRVGLLYSISGDAAFDESAILDATLLAIDEINAAGGILGLQIEPVLEDGASDPLVFAEKATKLLTVDQVEVVFGIGTTASRKAVRPVFEENNGLLFYPVQYEGIEQSSNIFYLGSDPSQQIVPTIDYLLSEGIDSFYIVGSDNRYTEVIHQLIVAQLADSDARLLGESFVSLEDTDLSSAISNIDFLKPAIVINTLVGVSNQAFFATLDAEQLPDSVMILSFNTDEIDIPAIGADLVAGYLTAQSYYQTLETIENFAFVEKYKAAYGRDARLSDAILSGYSAVYLWKTLVEQAGSFEVSSIQATAQAGGIELQTPNGLLQLDPVTQQLAKPLRIGRIRADGLIEQISGSRGNIPPDPFLTQYPWATETVARLFESNE